MPGIFILGDESMQLLVSCLLITITSQLASPLFDQCSGNGVVETKSDGLQGMWQIPVRQVSTAVDTLVAHGIMIMERGIYSALSSAGVSSSFEAD